MKGFKPNTKMSHSGDMGGDGRTHRKIEKVKGYAVGGIASGGPAFKVTSRARTPQEEFADKVNRGILPPEGNKPNFPGNRGGGGGPAPTMIPGPKDNPSGPIRPMPPVIPIRPMPGGIKGKLQPVPLKPAPRELYLGGSKDFDESTGTYRGRPAFKKGGSAKGRKGMK